VITLYRTLLGTFVYTIIVVLAAPFPSAAGLFLTFPALNGLAFYFSPQSSVPDMARSMLPVPVINGALCALYVVVFLALAQVHYITVIAWALIFIVAYVWWRLAWREDVRPPEHQLRFAIIVTVVGCAAAIIATFVIGEFASAQEPASSPNYGDMFYLIPAVLWRSKLKIILFAICLAAFLIITARLPITPRGRGILGALPIVPFGGLVSIAGDWTATLTERVHSFEGAVGSVWLGPAVAVWFIYGYSTYLRSRRPRTMDDDIESFAVLISGWLLSGVIILTAAYLLSSI